MRRNISAAGMSIVLALAAPFSAWPVQPGTQNTPVSKSAGAMAARDEQGTSHGAINPEDYLHRDVVNTQDNKVGEVEMLVMSRTGTVEAVIDIGGFLGVGEQRIVVPIDQLQPKDDKVMMSTSLADDELKRATPYKPDDFSPFETESQENRSPEGMKKQ